MDTTESYIKMCYKAFPEDAKEGLKTQDQLQEMISLEAYSILIFKNAGEPFAMRISPRVNPWPNRYQLLGGSMEQLWLAFVMREKYNKTWDGEEWK